MYTQRVQSVVHLQHVIKAVYEKQPFSAAASMQQLFWNEGKRFGGESFEVVRGFRGRLHGGCLG